MQSRRDQILSAADTTCDWIWRSGFELWITQAGGGLFWIKGKPGSGKSTGMKYLSEPRRVHDKVRPSQEWLVAHFSLDFRAGTGIENSISGLYRALLHQIVNSRSMPDNMQLCLKEEFQELKASGDIKRSLTEGALAKSLDQALQSWSPT